MHRTPREQPDLEVQVPAAYLCPVLGRLTSVAPAPTPPTVAPCPRGGRSPTARARAEGPEQTPRWPEAADAAREELRAGGAQLGAPQSAAPGCFLRPGPKTSGGPRSTPLSTELLPPGSAPGEGQGGSTWPAVERISQHRRRRRGIWAAALPVGGLIKDVITAPRPGALIKMLFLVVENCKQLASCTGRNLFTSLGRYAEVMALT